MSTTTTVGVATRQVDYEDVDDVIGIAAEMADADADRLSVEELQEVAVELEIPEQNVLPAIAELRRRRAVELARDAEAKTKASQLRWVVVGLLVLLLAWFALSISNLASLEADVVATRAQVETVLARKTALETQWGPLPDSADKRAELTGAVSRVAVERRHYDQAAAAYNSARGGFPAVLLAPIFGFDAAPPSNAIPSW